MKKPFPTIDSCVIVKLVTGEEMIVRVVDITEDEIVAKDCRTVGHGKEGNIGLMNSFMLGGDLQRGTIYRKNVTAIGEMGAEMEKKYLGELAGIVTS